MVIKNNTATITWLERAIQSYTAVLFLMALGRSRSQGFHMGFCVIANMTGLPPAGRSPGAASQVVKALKKDGCLVEK